MAAGTACPWLHGMANNGGKPTDGPEAGGADGQQRMSLVTELRPMENALPPTTLADECALYLCHRGALDSRRKGRRPAWRGYNFVPVG